ncbi:hypothetical protein GPJ56_008153 [Histomonas meleagridis]|uniref:uncharacterized protein n=1 Tax=Histomonas meleagridis TaxID=135588 RepID=UPI003559A254|nr:hypothetical protein GPJ56_008153 [Histomonas meleagridis]KAH0803107.1 hypothetical protein GO595_004200 [Histomonas meleagridis]
MEKYINFVPSPENSTYPPPDKPDDESHKPLEDFVCNPPALRFINKRKLAEASRDLKAFQESLRTYRPSDHFLNLQPPLLITNEKSKNDHKTEVTTDETNESSNSVITSLLQQIPAITQQYEFQEIPNDIEFQNILRRHAEERSNLAYDFRKEHSHILYNYYDAQVRENMQKNDMIDHRPLSDALRHISKRISYPVDLGVQRFYKYNVRYEKIIKKHKKSIEKLNQNQEARAAILYQKQLKDIQAYGDIHHLDITSFRVPKVATLGENEN